jgi:hypothetical protein
MWGHRAVAMIFVAAFVLAACDGGGGSASSTTAALSIEPDGSADEQAVSAEPESPVEAEPPAQAEPSGEAEATGGGTQESVIELTKAEYLAQANAMCRAAEDSFLDALHQNGLLLSAGHSGDLLSIEKQERAGGLWVRFAEKLFTGLIAIPPPEPDLAELNEAYLIVERHIDVQRQMVTAAAEGDTSRFYELFNERDALSDQVYGALSSYGLMQCALGAPL